MSFLYRPPVRLSRARRCKQNEVSGHFLITGTSQSVTLPSGSPLAVILVRQRRRCSSIVGAHFRCLACAMWLRLLLADPASILSSSARTSHVSHHYLVGPVLSTQRYFTPRPKTGLLEKACGNCNVYPAPDFFGALAVYDEVIKLKGAPPSFSMRKWADSVDKCILAQSTPKYTLNLKQ